MSLAALGAGARHRSRRRSVIPLLATVGVLLAVPAVAEMAFREVAAEWGLAFRHHHGGSGQRYMVETMVGGVVLFDYDGDADPDVFFVDGGMLPGYQGETPRSRLYRNDGGRFVDVTAQSGIVVAGYGCGAVAGDVDGDGDLDLYVTQLGPSQLFRNEGDGTFRDVTAAAGVPGASWSAGAAFADADRDGDLDLYVAGYVDFSPIDNHKFCGDEKKGIQGYCTPVKYNGLPDHFYRNRGDGTFEDATAAAGLGDTGNGLGVLFLDLTDDGWPDLFVANDLTPNLIFLNKKDGTFEDVSLLSGAAYGNLGKPQAGMGVDAADVDGNGQLDVVVTNFVLETIGLYMNQGDGLFVDARYPSGLAEPSLRKLAFGISFGDLDLDGDEDLLVADGHVLDNPLEVGSAGEYEQTNQLYEQVSPGRFREVQWAGSQIARVSRGVALGDLDGDGDLEAVFVNSNGVAEVYENRTAVGSAGWLQVDVAAPRGNTAAVGAKVELVAGPPKQLRLTRTGASYLSQNAATVTFGVGSATAADRLRVRWPDGKSSELRRPPLRHRLVLQAPAG